MAETVFERYEAKYREMGELLLGSVRVVAPYSWTWSNGGQQCCYSSVGAEYGGLLTVIDTDTEDGVTGKHFVFGTQDILSVVDIALGREQLQQREAWQSLLSLHVLEKQYDPTRQPTVDERVLFWSSLQAPLSELEA